MNLASVVHYLETDAPRYLAEDWDNVGLLVEPSDPHKVRDILLTNDLTLAVCQEAIDKKVNLILSYHPPIFAPFKRLTQKSVKERIIVKCIENRIAVYAPHTIYDNCKEGVNYWLLEAFSNFIDLKSDKDCMPIHQKLARETPSHGGASHRLDLKLNSKADLLLDELRKFLPGQGCVEVMKYKNENQDERLLVNLYIKSDQLVEVTDLLEQYPNVLDECSVLKLDRLPMPGYGTGLSCDVAGLNIAKAVECVKEHLELEHVRLALGFGKTLQSEITSVAVCAGSGRSVLQNSPADLYLTGEMSHHDVLACTELGISLILVEHSNSERGFLKKLKRNLEVKFEQTGVVFHISVQDHDPLKVV